MYVSASVGGWNPDANAWELPPDQAAVLQNFLIYPGKLVARGGITAISDLTSQSITPLYLAGAVLPSTGYTLFSQKALSGTAYIDPWNAPNRTTTPGKLASGVSKMWYVNNATGAPTSVTTANADQIIGPRWINFDGLLYGISYDSAGSILFDAGNSYCMKPVSLLTLAQSGTPLPTVLSNAPHGALDLKGHLGRIWLLGGCDTPGANSTHMCNALFFTNGVNTTAGVGTATSDWQDPVQGTTNIIKMDNNTADYGVALAVVRNGLLVLRRSSIWFLKGTTTANFTIYPISRETGCLDARSVVETDLGVYFVGPKGLMLTDGVRVTNVSGTVTHTLQQAINLQQRAIQNGTGGWITCALTTQGQILLSMGTYDSNTAGHQIPLWSAMYDPSVIKGGAWTQLTSAIWSTEEPTNNNIAYPGILVSASVPGQLYSIGDKYVTQLEECFTADTTFLVNGASTPLYDKLPSGGTPYLGVPYVWQTKIYPIAGTATNLRRFGIGKRFFIDYVFAGSSLSFSTAWQVFPQSATGSTYGVQLNTPLASLSVNKSSINSILVPPLPSPTIQRVNQDFTAELDDTSFLVLGGDSTARASAPPSAVAEIYGIGLEWQKSRERR